MSLNNPLIVRAAYLHLYYDIFREMGVPVGCALEDSRLPDLIEEQSEAYVSLPLALEWVARAGSDLAPMELGFLASKGLTLDSFDPLLRASLQDAVCGRVRIQNYFRLLAIEDNSLTPSIHQDGTQVRLNMSMPRLDQHPHACLAEWVNVRALIAIIRSFAGPDWAPKEIALVARLPAPEAASATFGNTRILVGQSTTSILVEAEVLATPCHNMTIAEFGGDDAFMPDERATEETWSFVTALRSVIQPYICEGRTDLAMVAEIVGLSPRTLQRKLSLCNTSYAGIVQEARFCIARSLLSDRSAKISDVAMMSGYQNPQHFSRAFRRTTGLTPTEYRSRHFQTKLT